MRNICVKNQSITEWLMCWWWWRWDGRLSLLFLKCFLRLSFVLLFIIYFCSFLFHFKVAKILSSWLLSVYCTSYVWILFYCIIVIFTYNTSFLWIFFIQNIQKHCRQIKLHVVLAECYFNSVQVSLFFMHCYSNLYETVCSSNTIYSNMILKF